MTEAAVETAARRDPAPGAVTGTEVFQALFNVHPESILSTRHQEVLLETADWLESRGYQTLPETLRRFEAEGVPGDISRPEMVRLRGIFLKDIGRRELATIPAKDVL